MTDFGSSSQTEAINVSINHVASIKEKGERVSEKPKVKCKGWEQHKLGMSSLILCLEQKVQVLKMSPRLQVQLAGMRAG